MIPAGGHDLEALKSEFIRSSGLASGNYTITPRSPWPSELFALFAVGRARGIRTWLEGGTYHGQAAAVLASVMPEIRVVTIEIDAATARVAADRLHHFGPRVVVETGDAHPRLLALAETEPGPVGVFIDGPKGIEAFRLAYNLIALRTKVSFVAMHDMSLSVTGRAVPARAAIDELGRFEPQNWASWATDDEEYVAWAKSLDDGLHAAHITEDGRSGWRPYEHFAAGEPTFSTRSYGPTVAFLLRP